MCVCFNSTETLQFWSPPPTLTLFPAASLPTTRPPFAAAASSPPPSPPQQPIATATTVPPAPLPSSSTLQPNNNNVMNPGEEDERINIMIPEEEDERINIMNPQENERIQLQVMQLQSNHPALRYWTFSRSEIQNNSAAAEALKHNSTVTTLDLPLDMQQEPPEGLLHFLQHTTNLKSLTLRSPRQQQPTRPDLRFIHALCHNESIENLHFYNWSIRDVVLILQHHSQLKTLTLSADDEESEDDSKKLALLLKAHPNLVSLIYGLVFRFRRSTKRNDCFTHLELDQGHASLRNLDIDTDFDSQYLRQVLKSPSCPLHQLKIHLDDPGQSFDEIMDGLESNTSLLSLSLSAAGGSPITVHRARRFQRFLAANTCSLKTLSLCCIKVLDGVNEVPIDSMVGSNALTNIHLSCCLQNANLWPSLLSNSIKSIECNFGDFDRLEIGEFDSICQTIAESVTTRKRFCVYGVNPDSAIPLTQLYEALRESPSLLSALCLYWYDREDDENFAVEGLCRLFQNSTTAKCEIESSDDRVEHCRGLRKESDRGGLQILEIIGREIQTKTLMSLLHVLTLNSSTLQTLDIRHDLECKVTGEDHFRALILHLPNIKGLRKLKFSVVKKNLACSGAENLLNALEQNTSLTSVFIQGALAPYDAEQERSYRCRVKSICRRNLDWQVRQVPSMVFVAALYHALDGKNTHQAYSLISNRHDFLEQGICRGTCKRRSVHDG